MTAELLAAIRAAPDDDAPRLVYADWLLERGDRRGELIIAQCTRRACETAGDYTSDAYRNALVTESVVLSEVRKPWFAEVDVEDAAAVTFRRGFPLAVAVPPARLFGPWAAIAELPLEVLVFTEPTTVGHLRQFAELPPNETVKTFSVTRHGATAHLDVARALEMLPHVDWQDPVQLFQDDMLAALEPFDECTTVLGHGHAIDGGVVSVFQDGTPLPTSLRALLVDCNGVDASQLFPNIRTNAKRLESLQLYDAETDDALAALDDWSHQHLHTLRLDSTRGRFPIEVGRRFAISGAARTLRHLWVDFSLDDLVATALETGRLERLGLTGGGDAAALEHVLRHQPNLHELSLGGFTGDVVGALERAAPKQLSVLTLRDLPTLDIARLGRWEQRLSSLAVSSAADSRSLLQAPALAGVPWMDVARPHERRAPAWNVVRNVDQMWPWA